jgi:hypothetical protein
VPLRLGAFKPLECSNTAKLDVEHGWDGIVVEPRAVGLCTLNQVDP